MLKLIPLPAFADNYLWLLHDGRRALVVDPGDATPVLRFLQAQGLRLETILVTHHHADHTGGVDELRQATGARVYGPAGEPIPGPYLPLHEGDALNALGLDFQVLEVPGHTSGHIAYYAAQASFSVTGGAPDKALPPLDTPSTPGPAHSPGRPLLFCGDTLFSGGCGRLFEGTPAQMLASLDKLAALPGNTCVCCTHEYTLSNLRFALAVEPGNAALTAYHAQCVQLRAHDQPTLPTTIANELLINPFLRTRQAAVKEAAKHVDAQAHDDVSVFAAIRQWKNQFK